ncbi:signal peptidase I [Lactococcus hodotermopsidis]|uniref:Signal peptidase I n=1 Tax=Pseudolactococcus hodotermopsidis TaxID=2709157 RepID=A0A6A0BDP5_9LACT|nr:signal peptidase I [Lactococcus hodotermopsidis]GFH42813.1 signal peptidase I [Lactococcus hodotermopsidis]
MKLLKEWGPFIGFLITILLLQNCFTTNVRVSGHSMDPTLADRQKIIAVKKSTINRFDIVTAKEIDPKNGEVKSIIKRVIGLPGDTVTFDNDVLTINGETYDETYLDDYKAKFKNDKLQAIYAFDKSYQKRAIYSPSFTFDRTGQVQFTIEVPKDEYLLLGDNRVISADSREVGTFKRADITGEAKFRYFPFNKIGFLD